MRASRRGATFGDDNTIREYVTISRGTAGGGGVTRVGGDCLIMAYTHIGHDSHDWQRVHSAEWRRRWRGM